MAGMFGLTVKLTKLQIIVFTKIVVTHRHSINLKNSKMHNKYVLIVLQVQLKG